MPLPIQNFGHILTNLVDAVLVGDELALDVLTLQRAVQQGGYPADRADRLPDSCWHAGKRRSSAILADSYAALLYLPLGNTAQFPPYGLSTAPAAAARHLRCQNAR